MNQILQNHFLIDFITKESLQNGMYYNFPTSSGFIEIFKENDELTVSISHRNLLYEYKVNFYLNII